LVTADAASARGWTPLQAARACDLGDFAGWAGTERIVPNLHGPTPSGSAPTSTR
jgi:cyclase